MSHQTARARSRAVLSMLGLWAVTTGCSAFGPDADHHRQPPPPPTTVPLIVVDVSTRVSGLPDPPKVGVCRRDGSLTAKWRRYDAQPPVPCDQAHGLETWKVAALPERWRTVKHLPLADETLDKELARAVDDLCPPAELDGFLGLPVMTDRHGTRHRPSVVIGSAFTPSPAAWSAGARWVRCDVGYRWNDPNGSLPRTLAAGGPRGDRPHPEIDGGLCVDRDGFYLRCAEPHVSEVMARYTNVLTARPVEETDRSAHDDWVGRCDELISERLNLSESRSEQAPAELRIVVSPSSAAAWSEGDRRVNCELRYVSGREKKDWRQTVGSARWLGGRLPQEVS
jgi:hypothetical protein